MASQSHRVDRERDMCDYFLIKPEPTTRRTLTRLNNFIRSFSCFMRSFGMHWRVSVCTNCCRWSSCTTTTASVEYEKCNEINWRRKINGNISLMVMLLFRHSIGWVRKVRDKAREVERERARAIGVIIIYHSVVLPKSNRIISASGSTHKIHPSYLSY